MKGWNQSSKKKRSGKGKGKDKGKGNGNGNGEESKIKQSACICLLFELPLQKRINVLAIDTSEELGPWFFEAEVVDYLLYQTIFDQPGKIMKVYAYDLTAGKEDEEQETGEEAETFDDDPLPDDYSLVTVPIFGLSHVTDTVTASKSTVAFVVHLRNNVFCLVCIYTSRNAGGRARHVRACVFEVDSVELLEGTEFTKRYLVAENVTQADWIIDSGPKLGIFSASKTFNVHGFGKGIVLRGVMP
ncbi:hypothetical protein HYC85_017975 [Camellia sinensis]|uniref:Uncharacterized protein n=1 Tax=Camellia sinensis TaxID=4442 RepID=A0A7J7GWX0_CAMSI|nr:hypothetical protein HYC85_017975 [Camellia sinensis]